MGQLLWIALGGGLGAVARHGTGLLCERLLAADLPWGTFVVNAFGSLLLGMLMESFASREWASPGVQVFLTTGFLGAFTTFSTYSVQAVRLVERGAYGPAAAHILANVLVGLCLAGAGIALVRRIAS